MAEDVHCRFDYAWDGWSARVELVGLEAQISAWQPADVPSVLSQVEAAAGQGLYAGGFVSYEAAPAFDEALRTYTGPPAGPSAVPLAWFGLFSGCREAAALQAAGPERLVLGPWRSELDASEHARAISSIRCSIAAGDAYLVNYTTRFRADWPSGAVPEHLYARLVAGHASGYHAFIDTPDWAVACGSPELFFELSHGRLTSRPMKGTAPRGRWADEDRAQGQSLGCSDKERAENVMVVDLLRNDMGRIASPGTVGVPALWQVERHPTVWQLTSTVAADLAPGTGLSDVFAALFPCGSVTGAPKASAMEIISRLERSRRGVYCGAVGLVAPPTTPGQTHLGLAGARFAVAIRTAVVDKSSGVVEYGSGGGVTWGSRSAQEWEELVVKTRVLTAEDARGLNGELLETMAFVPDGGGGAVRNLSAHLARMRGSAHYFDLRCPLDLEALVGHAVAATSVASTVRLLLGTNGKARVEVQLLAPGPDEPIALCLDGEPVASSDPSLFHKTSDRRRYDRRRARHPRADDVVMVNERGEVTETTRANLAALIGGQWCTPPLGSGLLPGVERARLLATGRVQEKVVSVAELRTAAGVATFSSMRGWRAARLTTPCSCPRAGP